MVILAGAAMQWVGYEPNAEQTDATKFALRALYGIVPCIAFGIGIAMFSRFKLTEDVHSEICEELEVRRSARTTP